MEMDYQRSKSMTIVSGVIAGLFGLLLIMLPGLTVGAFLVIFAVYLLVFGIARVVQSVMAPEGSKYRLPWLILGVLAFLAGIALFIYPSISVMLLAYFASFYAIAIGVVELIVAFAEPRSVGREILLIIAGVLSILFGLYLLVYPLTGLVFLISFLGWYSLIYGVILIIYGITRNTNTDNNPPVAS